MAKMQLCPLVPCNFAMFCGMIYIIVIMVGTFYFSSIMSSQQQSYIHLSRNNSSVYFVVNRRLSFDPIDDAKEKHYYVTVGHPQSHMRKTGNSSLLVPLCYVQWLLPLLPFCDKHRQQDHSLLTIPTKSTNKMQSENGTSIGSDQKDRLTNDNQYFARSKGKYNVIDLSFSKLVSLVYVSTAFIFGFGVIIILVFSLCVCVRSWGTDCNKSLSSLEVMRTFFTSQSNLPDFIFTNIHRLQNYLLSIKTVNLVQKNIVDYL